jgi:hypothetical protein
MPTILSTSLWNCLDSSATTLLTKFGYKNVTRNQGRIWSFRTTNPYVRVICDEKCIRIYLKTDLNTNIKGRHLVASIYPCFARDPHVSSSTTILGQTVVAIPSSISLHVYNRTRGTVGSKPDVNYIMFVGPDHVNEQNGDYSFSSKNPEELLQFARKVQKMFNIPEYEFKVDSDYPAINRKQAKHP